MVEAGTVLDSSQEASRSEEESSMSSRCRCGTEVHFAFNHLGCIACGAACCPACSYQLESASYCSSCPGPGPRSRPPAPSPERPSTRSHDRGPPGVCLRRGLPDGGAQMESKGRTFRRLLAEEPYLFTGGIYSPLDAQIAEQAGMKSIYLSGYSLAMLNGWPDMGFLTMTEVTRAASMVASAVELPVIADADDGYGNALSTIRTVQEFVKTGVAGIHLEDQRFPKRCGHIAGKTIVSREEALGKYRAAIVE